MSGLFTLDAPVRSEGTMDRVYRDLAAFLEVVRGMSVNPRSQPWRRAIDLRWVAFLAEQRRVEILADLDLYAWSRQAAVDAVAAHLPQKVWEWNQSGGLPRPEWDPPIEPSMRDRG